MAYEYNRKVNQTGNSITVSIPSEIAKQMDIKKGDDVSVIFESSANEFIVRKKPTLPENVRPEIISALDKIINRYDETLKNLRDRYELFDRGRNHAYPLSHGK